MSVGRIVAGKYCLQHELGRGGMGSVWAAEHLALRSRVAVKVIEPQIAATPNVQERFEREARALATLRSAHIVQVLDYGVDAGVQYLVMELLHGETLRNRLRTRGPLPAVDVYMVIDQVARAMAVTHAAGFVHRDLKPENIFLVDEGSGSSVKVLDFGITKALASEAQPLTSAGAILGTCQYMSPEQAAGQTVEQRSDLWSLGVIAFECLFGFPAFKAESAVAVLSAICHGPIVVPSDVARVPEGFDTWFARAVARNPAERFKTSGELADALRPLLGASGEWFGNARPSAAAADEVTLQVDAFLTTPLDRRGNVRLPSSIPAGIDGRRDARNTALIYNTSRSGALLAARRSWELGHVITLTLHLDDPDRGELVDAFVARVSERDDPYWRFEIGVRFVEPLSDALLARVEAKAKLS
jgi:serine/threonine protein kinase